MGIEIDLIFVREGELVLFSVCGPKMTCFEYRDRLTWFFVCVVDDDLVFVCGLLSSGDIRGTSPGFLWGYGSWGTTDDAPCCWEYHPHCDSGASSRWLFSGIVHVS